MAPTQDRVTRELQGVMGVAGAGRHTHVLSLHVLSPHRTLLPQVGPRLGARACARWLQGAVGD